MNGGHNLCFGWKLSFKNIILLLWQVELPNLLDTWMTPGKQFGNMFMFVSESLAAIECSWVGCLFNSRMVMKSLRQHHGEHKMSEFQFLRELCLIDPRALDKGQMLSEGELYYCQIWKICQTMFAPCSQLIHTGFNRCWEGSRGFDIKLSASHKQLYFKFGSLFYF